MVPSCVPDVMNQLGIINLEVERMHKQLGVEFFHPNDASYLSMVTPSTHDMSTIRGWWQEDREKTQRFYNYMLGQYGEAPADCEGWINKRIVLQHLYSPAMWSIFLLSDLLGIDENIRRENPEEERINVPSDPHHHWKYRMHLNLEDLLMKKEFNEDIRKIIEESGRNP
jgi:4-alpha-glucanotransferase